jgi:hypothetical protein
MVISCSDAGAIGRHAGGPTNWRRRAFNAGKPLDQTYPKELLTRWREQWRPPALNPAFRYRFLNFRGRESSAIPRWAAQSGKSEFCDHAFCPLCIRLLYSLDLSGTATTRRSCFCIASSHVFLMHPWIHASPIPPYMIVLLPFLNRCNL